MVDVLKLLIIVSGAYVGNVFLSYLYYRFVLGHSYEVANKLLTERFFE